MTELIACLSTGKGSWGQVSRLISQQDWEKVFLLTNEFGKDKFTPDNKTELLTTDTQQDTSKLRDTFYEILKDRVKGTEVAINMCSGSGKEHMALIAAVLKLGVGLRFIDNCDGTITEL